MSEPVKPALTEREWKEMEANWSFSDSAKRDEHGLTAEVYHATEPHIAHGLAALALYGQQFGFDWKDVEALRLVHVSRLNLPRLESLADRIEALLPPEEK